MIFPVRVGEVRCGCADCLHTRNPHGKCQLTNAVHPIWQQSNWMRGAPMSFDIDASSGTSTLGGSEGPLTTETYLKLKPALQLATLLLEKARPFLTKILFAELLPGRIFDEAYQSTPSHERQCEAALQRLAKSVRIFSKVSYGECDRFSRGAGAWGLAFTYAGDTDFNEDSPFHMAFNPRYLEAVEAETWLPSSHEDKHHVLFPLAVCAVHELAHLLWMDRMHQGYLNDPRDDRNTRWTLRPDPCLLSAHDHDHDHDRECEVSASSNCELGEAVEHFLLGGQFHLLRMDEDTPSPTYAVFVMQTPFTPLPARNARLAWMALPAYQLGPALSPAQALVQSECVSRFFCTEMWENLEARPLEITLSHPEQTRSAVCEREVDGDGMSRRQSACSCTGIKVRRGV